MLKNIFLGLLLLSISAAASEPTHFRKQHTIAFYAKKGEPVALKVRCLRASVGYADNAAYTLLGPFGKLLEKGIVLVDREKTIRFAARVSGTYSIHVDPGMNAFAIEPSVRQWAVDISDGRRLNIIRHARPLFFYVPKGTTAFTLKMHGEPGKVAIYDGDGALVKEQTLPLYKPVEILLPVGKGKDAAAWRMELELAEDQGILFPPSIPPYIAERPITETDLEYFAGGPGIARFDLQRTPSGPLALASRPPVAQVVKTEDGLAVGFSAAGQIAAVRLDGKDVAPRKALPLAGFFARDAAGGPELVPVSSAFERTAAGLRQKGQFPGMGVALDATVTAKADHIAIDGFITDTTGKDRAISLYFALPIAPRDLVWWDDIDHTRPIRGAAEYYSYNRCPAGANGRNSIYPFGCVGGAAGLAIGIPLDKPCVNRIAYNAATGQLYTAFDFALTPATREFPQRARFSLVIYTHDGRWGLRAAAKKYYGIFPKLVENRMKRDGGWVCWSSLKSIRDLADFGFLYHWGPGGASAVAYDDKIGVFSFLYNDSVRYFADLGAFPKKPDTATCQKVFEAYLTARDPRAFVLSRPAKATGRRRYEGIEHARGREAASDYLRRCVKAVRTSAAYDAAGNFIIGYVINRKGWGPANWWTGRLFCNPDPDIPGGYGRFLLTEILGRAFAGYRSKGGELDGVGLDNYFVNAYSLNFRREHFAYVDYPLTFSRPDCRPVQIGDFALYEWVEALAGDMRKQGKYVMANMGKLPFPFAATLLDMHGYEWGIERVGAAARTLAYHKPVVTLPVKPEHYTEPWIRQHVRFGFFPGGYGGRSKFASEPELRALYKRYVPAIRRLAEAGWEPVTFAAVDHPAVRIERFGGQGRLPLYFTLANAADKPAVCSAKINAAALRLNPSDLRVETLLCGEVKGLQPGPRSLTVSLAIPAKSTSVLVVAGK